jgi:tRNA dimethylallyltransferase
MIAVVGPTAAGKSAAAVAIAHLLEGEVIGADSRQVYAGMAIGTAQPTVEEREGVPHHLVGCLPPDHPFGLAQYLDAARAAITAVRARGHVPVLTGGTGQYVQALLEGWTVPRVAPDPALRLKYEEIALREGPAALHRTLESIDRSAAARIHPNNVRRVIRALEVHAHTGRPISAQQRHGDTVDAVVIGLNMARELLHQRTDERVRRMFRAGFVTEVEELRSRGFGRGLPSMQSIGYPEVWALLEGEIGQDEAVLRTQQGTHRLVRQQQTWFRPDGPRITWIDACGDPTAAVRSVLSAAGLGGAV